MRTLLPGTREVLALGAHPDDIELGCGGTLLKLKTSGAGIHLAVFSKCTDENPEDSEVREREYLEAAKVLGADSALIFDLPNRLLPEHRESIMTEMAKLQATLRPDTVFIPFLQDPHQDHETIANAGIRTFRGKESILQYEILRYGSHTLTPSLFVDVSATLDAKVSILKCYRSQLKQRKYYDEESFRSLARTRGAQSGYGYAEGFVVYKMFL